MPQVEAFFRVAFKNAFVLAAQEKMSKLEGTAQRGTLRGEMEHFDNYGSISMREEQQRNQDVIIDDLARNRRTITPRDFAVHTDIARTDKVRLGDAVEPNGTLMKALMASLARQKNDVIISEYAALARGGKNGTATFPFDTTNQDIADGGVNLTALKLRTAARILDSADVEEEERRVVVMHPRQLYALANDSGVVFQSEDFRVIQGLIQKSIKHWIGFDFITTTRITQHATDRRYVFAYSAGDAESAAGAAMIFGINPDSVQVEIDTIPMKSHMKLISVYGTMASVRQFENKIVRINNVDT